MVDSALIWIGLVAMIGVISLVRLVQTYATTGDFSYWSLAVVLVCCTGVLELGMANDYLPPEEALDFVSGLSLVVAIVFGLMTVLNRDFSYFFFKKG